MSKNDNLIIAGNKIYDYCDRCGELVRINKPFIGSLHICEPLPKKISPHQPIQTLGVLDPRKLSFGFDSAPLNMYKSQERKNDQAKK